MPTKIADSLRRLPGLLLRHWEAPLASQAPVLQLVSPFLDSGRVPVEHAARAAALFLVAAALCLVAGPVDRAAARAAAFVAGIVGWISYPFVAAGLGVPPLGTADVAFSVLYCVVVGAGVGYVLRAVGGRAELLSNVARAVSVGLLVAVVLAVMRMPFLWQRNAFNPLVATVSQLPLETRMSGPLPDIVHVVLDGMAGPAVLERKFGIRQQEVHSMLGAAGLSAHADAHANYSQTFLSFASMLNMNYLEPIPPVLRRSRDRRPLAALIHQSSVVRTLKQLGYRFVLLGSGYEVADGHPLADECLCGPVPFAHFDSYLLAHSPLRNVPVWRVAYGLHRDRIEQVFTAVAGARRGHARPSLVVAHVLVPHPPFVFDAAGQPRAVDRPFETLDGNWFRGSREEYRQGYAAQARYAIARTVEAIQHARDASTRPLLVLVHGDHGPGLDARLDQHEGTDAQERLSILLATSFPTGMAQAGPVIRSPVNIYRVIFTALGMDGVAPYDDRAWLSPFTAPYDFRQVEPAAGPPAAMPR